MTLDEKIKKSVHEELMEFLEKNKVKEKKFRYPFGKKVGKSQRKKNYVTVWIINENKTINCKKYQIDNQTILEEKIPRLATGDYILRDGKGNPVIILPSWNIEPFSPTSNFNKSMDDGSNIKGYKIIMDRMESEKTGTKKKMGKAGIWIIGGILAAIIIYALVSGGAA